jgi:hypothetical protein
LVLDLAPTNTPLPPMRACLLAPDSTGFAAAQNGAWAQVPRYDCTNAPEAAVDANRTAMTFAAPARTTGGLLAVALVPTGPGRAAFKKPGDRALELGEPDASAGSSSTDDGFTSPAADTGYASAPTMSGLDAGAITMALPSDAGISATIDGGPAPTDADTSAIRPALANGPIARAAEGIWDLRKRLGGVLGALLLVAVLLFYSQGRGPLGARLDARSLLLRRDVE